MDHERLTRRRFLCQSGSAAVAVILAACSPAGQKTEQPGGTGQATIAPGSEATKAPAQQITLTYWQQDWGKDFNDYMLKLGDAFTEQAAPNVKVEMTFLPGISEKLAAAVAGGNPPDVCEIEEDYGVPKMARAGALLPLQEYYTRDGVKQEDFIPFTWETVLHKRAPYGIPGGAGANVLMYDKAVFRDAGIDPESVPDTPSWEQFWEWNQKTVKRDSSGKLVRTGISRPDAWGFRHMAGVLGVTYYNADKTKVTLNSPETVAALEKWASILPQDASWDEISNLLSGAPTASYGALGAGLVGLDYDGFWCFMPLDKYWPDLDYGMTKFPTPNGTKDEWDLYTGWVWGVTLPKGSKHPEEGWAYMRFGYWEHGELLADTLNWTSVLKAFPEFEKRVIAIMGEKNRMTPYLHHFSESQYTAGYFIPYTSIHAKLTDTLGQAVDVVMRKQKTAQEALDEVVATLQPELDKVLAEG